MTLVICDKTDCIYNREPENEEEEAIGGHFCGKTYIVLRKPEEESCDDYESGKMNESV